MMLRRKKEDVEAKAVLKAADPAMKSDEKKPKEEEKKKKQQQEKEKQDAEAARKQAEEEGIQKRCHVCAKEVVGDLHWIGCNYCDQFWCCSKNNDCDRFWCCSKSARSKAVKAHENGCKSLQQKLLDLGKARK